jgi:hypothetical protein
MARARTVLRQLAILVAVPAGIAMNYLVFAGKGWEGVVKDRPSPLQAAGYAFSIWGLIWLGQLLYAAHQARPSQRDNPVLRRVAVWTLVNAVATGAWPLAMAQQAFVQAQGWLTLMLVALIAIELHAGAPAGPLGRADAWLVRVVYGVNLGWVSVAMILSVASLLRVELGWQGGPWSGETWSLLAVTAAASLGLIMLFVRRNVAFAVVNVWALIALAVGGEATPASVSRVAAVAAAVVALSIVVFVVRSRGTHAAPTSHGPAM